MRRLLIIFTSALFVSCLQDEDAGASLSVGDQLPAFSVMMDDGTAVTDADFKEAVGLIVFFNTGCPDCVKELPVLQRVYDSYRDIILFCPISRSQDATSLESYWIQNGLTMPYSAQEDRTVYDKFAYSGIPRIYIVSDRVVRKVWTDTDTPSFDDIDRCLSEELIDGSLSISRNLVLSLRMSNFRGLK